MIVECTACGQEYDANEGQDCPACGSSGVTYDPAELDVYDDDAGYDPINHTGY